MKIFFRKIRIILTLKLTLKVRILQFLTTFTQLTARLKNFLMGWLLILGLKEGQVQCATVCVKSEVILGTMEDDGGVDTTVIDSRQHKMGHMADFPPLLASSVFLRIKT